MKLDAGLTGAASEVAATEASPLISSKSSSCPTAFELAAGAGAGHPELKSALVRADVVEIPSGAAGASGLADAADLAATGIAADAPVAAAPGLAGSLLRRSPRATRSVPLACSMLMGLVRTRLAPRRTALAPPACPSTTATASDAWLDVELRALLNNNVAFCSLSQSTTTASKCWPINFLTAANGSVQDSTLNSSSLKTCVTVRAVFSSGQKRRAW